MFGKKELNLVATGRKMVKKYKKNFRGFINGDSYLRLFMADKNSGKKKVIEFIVNADNFMDYFENCISEMDFGDYIIYKVEISLLRDK